MIMTNSVDVIFLTMSWLVGFHKHVVYMSSGVGSANLGVAVVVPAVLNDTGCIIED